MALAIGVYAQGKDDKSQRQKKYMIGGTLSVQSYFEDDPENDFKIHGKSFSILSRFGFILSEKFTLGLEAGYHFLDSAPYDVYVDCKEYYYFCDKSDYYTFYASGDILSIASFLRYSIPLHDNFELFCDWNLGVEIATELGAYCPDGDMFQSCNIGFREIKEYTKYFTRASSGVLINVTSSIDIEAQIVSIDFSIKSDKGDDNSHTELNSDFIFSKPNIGLLFYF
jgi:hypothetical protein